MAIIWPVFGSIATSPALYALKFFSFSADLVRNKSSNFSCHCQLTVVVTLSPPRSTTSSPYFSTRYSLTKREKCGAFIPPTVFPENLTCSAFALSYSSFVIRVLSKSRLRTRFLRDSSQTYFDKRAENLNIAESAYLAGMLQAPTRYSPYGSHRDELESRKNLVLSRLFDKTRITKEEYESAKAEQVKFSGKTVGGIKAPHFSLFVKEYLVEKYGEDVVERGGLKVTTTVNWQWQ